MSASFRRFALTVYEADGVAAATLLVQERCDVDVNVVLLAAYVGAVRAAVFDDDALAEAAHRVEAWRREVVVPLRTLRTRLKTGPAPAPTAETAEFRDRVKALELDAELIELDVLAAFADGRGFAAASGTARERAAAAMVVVTPAEEVSEAIAVIASAAAGYAGGR